MENPRGLTDIGQGTIYSPDELTQVLKLKKGQIIKLCRSGRLNAERAGKQWFIPGSSVILYFASIVGEKSRGDFAPMGVRK